MLIKNHKSKLLALMLITCLSSCTSNRSSSFAKSILNSDRRTAAVAQADKNTASKVITLLSKDQKLWNSSNISAASYNNSLLLIGQTNSPDNFKLIEKIVSTIPEVETVYNQIKVRDPISFKNRARDAWITTQVKAKLLSEPYIGPNRIKVYTEDSVVYLMGILTGYEERIATENANSVADVKAVVKVLDRMPTE